MATSLKTICFPFPPLASISDASVTNFTQITLNLPESSIAFKKVWVEVMADDIITVTGGTINERRIGLRLAAVAYNTVTNTNDIVHSSENLSVHWTADFTSYFTTNWSGSSMTCDVQIYLDQNTGTTLGYVNGSALLWVTYEYDDTSSTMVGNAWIPFQSLLSAMGTSKPAACDTVPNLDTFLGYGSLSYQNIVVIMEGNEQNAAGTTTFQVTCQIDSLTAQVTGNHVAALASDRYVRHVFDMMSGGSPLFTTNATHSIYWWVSTGAVSRMNHCAMTMLVVFTYDATSANDGNVSLMLTVALDGPFGGTTSSDYQRGLTDLWIEEPTTITIQNSAIRMHWTQIGTVGGLNLRTGAQSFSSYTDTGAAMCGGNCLQRTIHDDKTLARGKNTLSVDVYRTDTSDLGWAANGVWIINYKCGKPSGGWGRANRTVIWSLADHGTAAANAQLDVSATALTIPETEYFASVIGAVVQYITTSTSIPMGVVQLVERLSGEGGIKWECIDDSPSHDDPEVGLRIAYGDAQIQRIFKRWTSDPETNRIDIETSRRYRCYAINMYAQYWQWNLMITYHSITFAWAGTVSDSGGGTVTIMLHDSTTKNPLRSTTRVGNGAYSITWFDSAHNVFSVASEDSTHMGRSDDGVCS